MSSATTIYDRRDKFRAGAAEAMLMRMGQKKPDYNNEFSNMSLLEIARTGLDLAGVNYSGMDKRKIVGLSFSQPGSDFPGILENVATKSVLKGYDEAEEPYRKLARIGRLPDFKTANRSGLSHAPSLVLNRENQEVETLQLQDRKQSIQLGTYAGRFGISYRGIINDDLDEFANLGVRIGASARRTVGDQFASVFTQDPNGQTIDEGNARIFDAARNNTGTVGAPNTTTLSEGRVLMGSQTDKSGSAKNLNIQPKYIYCPLAHEGGARVAVTSERMYDGTNVNATLPNIEQNRWEVISDSRLDDNSASRWYGLADPNRYDTVEVAFLDGRDEPSIERTNQYDVLGVEWVCWIDCVAQALDFRTMFVNDGA